MLPNQPKIPNGLPVCGNSSGPGLSTQGAPGCPCVRVHFKGTVIAVIMNSLLTWKWLYCLGGLYSKACLSHPGNAQWLRAWVVAPVRTGQKYSCPAELPQVPFLLCKVQSRGLPLSLFLCSLIHSIGIYRAPTMCCETSF